MKPFDFQLIQWKCVPLHRHPLLSAYEARTFGSRTILLCCSYLFNAKADWVCVWCTYPSSNQGGGLLQLPLRFFSFKKTLIRHFD